MAKSKEVPQEKPKKTISLGFATARKGVGSTSEQFLIGAFGLNRTGKTLFAGSWPDLLYLDYDNSVRTLQSFYPDKEDIVVLSYEYGQGTTKGMDELIQMMDSEDGIFAKWKPKTICIDSLPSLCLHLQDELIKEGYQSAGNKDKGALSLPDYGRIINRVMAFIRKLRDTGAHIIITGTLDWREDPVTRNMIFFPNAIGGKLAGHVLDALDFICLFKADQAEKKYRAYMRMNENFPWAGYRGKVKDDVIDSITYEKFIKNII